MCHGTYLQELVIMSEKTVCPSLSCCRSLDWCWPWSQPQYPLGLPHHDLSVVSNYLPCQERGMASLTEPVLYICAAVYTCRAGHADQRLACIFNQSWLWMGGWKRQKPSQVIPGCSPSANEGKLSHRPLRGWQLAAPLEMPRISLLALPYFCLLCFLLSSTFRVFKICPLAFCLSPFYFFSLPSFLSFFFFSYFFSFHPSLWDNIHRTCQR